jgi:hypothetical protein
MGSTNICTGSGKRYVGSRHEAACCSDLTTLTNSVAIGVAREEGRGND